MAQFIKDPFTHLGHATQDRVENVCLFSMLISCDNGCRLTRRGYTVKYILSPQPGQKSNAVAKAIIWQKINYIDLPLICVTLLTSDILR